MSIFFRVLKRLDWKFQVLGVFTYDGILHHISTEYDKVADPRLSATLVFRQQSKNYVSFKQLPESYAKNEGLRTLV